MASKMGVILKVQGQADKVLLIGSGATLRSALTAAKIDLKNFNGSFTVNGSEEDLSYRMKSNDEIRLTPKVQGGI